MWSKIQLLNPRFFIDKLITIQQLRVIKFSSIFVQWIRNPPPHPKNTKNDSILIYNSYNFTFAEQTYPGRDVLHMLRVHADLGRVFSPTSRDQRESTRKYDSEENGLKDWQWGKKQWPKQKIRSLWSRKVLKFHSSYECFELCFYT